ncbi:hypothetical protein DEO72_LG9g2613 [Vigna unguiculata]|uniref:Transmembrane protein n=1 Tax=Vigna unguiculata TaxID=3917 RepID=A0A4D6N1A9_VIGUN|nr:hypothetical protein DEO72_LG9g2613 [Vigna unguiculata]
MVVPSAVLMSSTFQMQQWWLWWHGFAAAPICSKVVILQQWWFTAFVRGGAALCIWCVVHGGVMMVVLCWLQVVAHGVSVAEAAVVQWCVAEKNTKLWWPESLLPTRVAAAMVMERDDEN